MLRASLSLALLLGACGSRDSHPPISEPELEPPPGGSAEVANDPVRQDYRLVLAQCEDQQHEMETELTDAQRRRRRQAVAAAALYAVGEAADVENDSDQPLDSMGGQPGCPRDPDANRAGPCLTPTPTLGTTAQESPAQAQEDEVRSETELQLQSMDGAIAEADEFLFAHPHPHEWTEAERAEWTARRDRLAEICGYTASGPTGRAHRDED